MEKNTSKDKHAKRQTPDLDSLVGPPVAACNSSLTPSRLNKAVCAALSHAFVRHSSALASQQHTAQPAGQQARASKDDAGSSSAICLSRVMSGSTYCAP